MVDFRKILHQISPFGPSSKGLSKHPIYRITKTLATPANRARGINAVYTDNSPVEISGLIFPFVGKRWGVVADSFAEMVLVTNTALIFNVDNDDNATDEIDYNGIRYRITAMRHHETTLNDNRYDYAMVRKRAQVGGP